MKSQNFPYFFLAFGEGGYDFSSLRLGGGPENLKSQGGVFQNTPWTPPLDITDVN